MYKPVVVKGAEGILVKILKDSVNANDMNLRITSFEIELPRFIWAECLTHRQFSRNSASSRAIPVMKKLKMVWSNPAMFVHWGKNKSGMQAEDEIKGFRQSLGKFVWRTGSKFACLTAWTLSKLGFHKQISNRCLEPWERLKVVITTTELENWFWLRDHEDAQPEIREVARLMCEALNKSGPQVLKSGEWHLPYIETTRVNDGELIYLIDGAVVDVDTAIRTSVSSCAQVSYRVLDQSQEKVDRIYHNLIESEPVHASPCEHQAMPMSKPFPAHEDSDIYEDGVTHYNFKTNSLWSGNFQGWIQYRQLVPNNVKM